jgi:tetratricopeptide (TPR) repeat protein
MPGSRDITSKILPVLAILLGLVFICSWPRQFLYLRQYLPQQITLKWFLSFASLDTVTKVQQSENHINQAQMYIKLNQLDQALAECHKALETGAPSGFVPAYYNMAFINAKKGRFEEAVSFLTKAIEIDPNYADAYRHRGLLYNRLKEFDKARQDIQKAYALKPR